MRASGIAAGRRGFSLVELLVVVAIVVILMALMVPSLSKARDDARRVACAANLRQWGTALVMYGSDNNGYVVGSWFDNPGLIWSDSTVWPWTPYYSQYQLSCDKVAAYLPGFNNFNAKSLGVNAALTGGTPPWRLSKCFVCPAVENPNLEVMPGWFPHPGWGFATWMHYAYYGRVSTWTVGHATRAADLTDTQLMPNELLMSDMTTFGAAFPGGWNYNHGGHGPHPVWDDADVNGSVDGSIADCNGMNELFGDAHAEWKPADVSGMRDSSQLPGLADPYPCVIVGPYQKLYY